MRKDFLGNELFVNDQIIFVSNRRYLMRGTILEIGSDRASITHEKDFSGYTISEIFFSEIIKVDHV